ncbi:MAG: RNA-directed DNA polymerase [Nitrospira sp.]|nr:MAG: RNA-directed DNA polymerase [Nitrospira sp.]
MLTVSSLLEKGYFPKELPPPFTTAKFAEVMTKHAQSLPGNFGTPPSARLTMYNLARPGTLRRTLGIPNPVVYYNLCLEVKNNWKDIESQLKRSTLAGVTATKPGGNGRAVISSHLDKFTSLRATSRASARYLLKADISRFYPSIYTHSIPWAVHGKLIAKANRNKKKKDALYGDALDKWARKCQDDQTMGLPIGPDTSFILSELVLAAVDETLSTKVKKLKGFRHVDDYELCFNTMSGAQKALATLQEGLTQFELALNPVKTRIYELPLPLEKPWANELRTFDFRNAGESDLVRFFDRAFVLMKENPDESVLSYAIARTNSIIIGEDIWELFENLVLHCMHVEPNTTRPALEQFLRYKDKDYSINLALLSDVLNNQIRYHAPLGHSSEVAWALWALIEFKCVIRVTTVKIVTDLDDPLAALLALDAEQRGLLRSKLDLSRWASCKRKSELYGANWLLSYEGNLKGWLPSKGTSDYVNEDERFAAMKKLGVTFYNPNATIDFTPLPQTDVSELSGVQYESDDDDVDI